MEACGPAGTPMPSGTPMPAGTPLPSQLLPAPPPMRRPIPPQPRQPVYKPGHIMSYACANDCLPASGVWADGVRSFPTKKICRIACGRTHDTVQPGWEAGVAEGDLTVNPTALIGNIDRHVINYM